MEPALKAPGTLPDISVIIPAYNHESFVVHALDSVLRQDYPCKELVIIDDGSTDKTAAKIEAWIELHGSELKIAYVSRENRGVTRTLNELIAMSHGEYLTILASDDYLLPESLSLRWKYLNEHPEKKAVIGDTVVVDGDDRVLHESGLSDLHSANLDLYLDDVGLKREIVQNWSIVGGVMVERSLYDEFSYDEELVIEDRDFFLKLVSANSLGFVRAPVSAYRLHGNNFSFDDSNRLLASTNKFKSLLRNIQYFSARDRLLFVKPLTMSILGMAVGSIRKALRL